MQQITKTTSSPIRDSSKIGKEIRYNDQLGQTRPRTQAEIYTHGSPICTPSIPSVSHRGSHREDPQMVKISHTTQEDHSKSFSVIPRPVKPHMRYDPHGQTQHQTTAILPEQQMACSERAIEKNHYLTWWEDTDNTLAGAPLHAPHTSYTVFTDASTLSWGGHLNSQVVSGMWSKMEKKLHINLLEMKAILLTLMHFVHMVKDHCILIMSDNTTVVSYINKQGGTHSWSKFLMMQELFQWTERHNICVKASHIADKLNTVADMLSRKGEILPSEWKLNPHLFRQIQALCPMIQVDLFANYLNRQLPTYVSPFPDDQAWAVDALSFSWEALIAYAYPPTKLISQTLGKIQESDCIVLLIAPNWANQSWYPILLELMIEYPIWLPPSQKMLRQPMSSKYHTSPEVMKLHVWALSN